MKAYCGHIIYTPTSHAFEILPKGYVVVNAKGIIQGVYASDKYPYGNEIEVIDLGNQLLIPAMNDLHVHAPQFANMGIAMDVPLLLWLNKYTFPEEAKFADIEYARTTYTQFVDELVKQGTMRAAVFATIHTPATLLLADLFHQKGIGALIGLVAMDRSSLFVLYSFHCLWIYIPKMDKLGQSTTLQSPYCTFVANWSLDSDYCISLSADAWKCNRQHHEYRARIFLE